MRVIISSIIIGIVVVGLVIFIRVGFRGDVKRTNILKKATSFFGITKESPEQTADISPINQVPSQVDTSLINKSNPFGIMIPSSNLDSVKKITIAKDLGAVYYRGTDVKPTRTECEDCLEASRQGLRLALTLRNGGGGGQPSQPVTDIPAYKSFVSDMIGKYKPAILVVENEENSGALFYAGTPQQYNEELKAVCEVAHEKNVKCTNGGLVSMLVITMTWDSYKSQYGEERALEFIKRASPDRYSQITNAPKDTLKKQLDNGNQFISGYKSSGADYINFHWYSPDPQALEEVKVYLESKSGLSAITNEVGQQKNIDPQQVTTIMTKITNLQIPIAIWFSNDTPSGYADAKSLLNPDGSYRPNAEAYKTYIKTTYP